MGLNWIGIGLVVLVVIVAANDEEEHKAMVKRQINSVPLVYPYGGTYKLIIGLSAPIKSEDYVSLAFAANFQYQYVQFQNISELSQYYFIKTVSREQREAELAARKDERLTFYTAVADMLRSPDYGKTAFDDNKDEDLDYLMSPYNDAATAGRQMFNCASIYSGCPEGQGLMEMFSILRDE
ncbi:hypothetical protein HF086_009864 [Spodoptera exigua]|uniref:Uncharacterized protein n=1 Tax=Spodoptera exigua TaxID=7107 RepID=A0A922M4Q3_SPOEX|nr:hypothetical protein HF086_009864 [Spodoptera exigua]